MAPMPADTASFFRSKEFATDAVYTSPQGVKTTVPVIFDKEIRESAVGENLYEASYPTARVETYRVAGATNSSRLQVGTVNYYVVAVVDDGQGVTTLRLSVQGVN